MLVGVVGKISDYLHVVDSFGDFQFDIHLRFVKKAVQRAVVLWVEIFSVTDRRRSKESMIMNINLMHVICVFF